MQQNAADTPHTQHRHGSGKCAQIIVKQQIMTETAYRATAPAKNSNTAAAAVPFLLTKDYLCQRAGLTSGDRYEQLRRWILTDAVLAAAGIDPDTYRHCRFFDRQQTIILIDLLRL